ncbi:hypothetical protein ABEF95_005082 [Exophiala dermatitidis]
MSPLLFSVLSAFPLLLSCGRTLELDSRQSCALNYYPCSPDGASARDVPVIGPGLAQLYLDLIQTVNPSTVRGYGNTGAVGRAGGRRQSPGRICCAQNTQCLLVLSYNIPVCWDRFTTNYYLPDGSYGSISSGNYTTPAGDHANLITGTYELANGQTGNIYEEDPIEQPNTSTLLLPSPFTSSGVGSAIPASQVGGQATYTPPSMATYTPLPMPTYTSLPMPLLPPMPTSSTTSSANNNITGSGNATDGVRSTRAGTGTGSMTASVTGDPSLTPPITGDGSGHGICALCHQRLLLLMIVVAYHIWYA